jgi:hypothetical protein
LGSVEQVARDVLRGSDLFLERAPPRRERVRPCFHGECPSADSIDGELAEPAIFIEVEQHRRDRPIVSTRTFEQRPRSEKIVAVLDEIGTDRHRVADDALRRIPSSIHLRRHAFDDDVFQSSLGGATVGFSRSHDPVFVGVGAGARDCQQHPGPVRPSTPHASLWTSGDRRLIHLVAAEEARRE